MPGRIQRTARVEREALGPSEHIADSASNRVRRVDRQGAITTFARIAHPDGLAFDSHGNLYVAEPDENYIGDHDNGVIRKVDARGTITTLFQRAEIGLGSS